jgi:hypothetical protein
LDVLHWFALHRSEGLPVDQERKVRDEMGKRPLRALLRPSYLVVNGESRTRYPVGCALCQFGVPCMDKNPVAQCEQNQGVGEM